MQNKEFHKWNFKETDLEGLTIEKVRDLMVECFYQAQQDTFRHIRTKIGLSREEKDIRGAILSIVRLAFSSANGNFDKPTKTDLLKVMDFLAKQSARWGTPKDIIQHNKDQIIQLIHRI